MTVTEAGGLEYNSCDLTQITNSRGDAISHDVIDNITIYGCTTTYSVTILVL